MFSRFVQLTILLYLGDIELHLMGWSAVLSKNSLSKIWPAFAAPASIDVNAVVVWVCLMSMDAHDGLRICSRCRYADFRDGSRRAPTSVWVSRWFMDVHEKKRSIEFMHNSWPCKICIIFAMVREPLQLCPYLNFMNHHGDFILQGVVNLTVVSGTIWCRVSRWNIGHVSLLPY